MATLEQILNGMIAFRDEVYARLDEIEDKIDELLAKDEIWQTCSSCEGTGERRVQQDPAIVSECPDCDGSGKNKWGNMDTPA